MRSESSWLQGGLKSKLLLRPTCALSKSIPLTPPGSSQAICRGVYSWVLCHSMHDASSASCFFKLRNPNCERPQPWDKAE